MPRKASALGLAGGKGLRQRVWERIRALAGADFSLAEITLGGENNKTVRDYVWGLEHAGYLDVTQPSPTRGRGKPVKRWRLCRDIGAEAPRVRRDGTAVTVGLVQEQMWRTLRMLAGDISAEELAAHASTPQVPVSPISARHYLAALHQASYLERTRQDRARFRLVSNTGPRPPMVCRTDAIYDPNLDALVWVRPVTEEDVIYGH